MPETKRIVNDQEFTLLFYLYQTTHQNPSIFNYLNQKFLFNYQQISSLPFSYLLYSYVEFKILHLETKKTTLKGVFSMVLGACSSEC